MSITRVAAVGLIFVLAWAGWWTLGYATAVRSMEAGGRLGAQVEALWGAPLVQQAPSFAAETPGADRARPVMPSKNDVQVSLRTDYRKKGLIWYPTYVCTFDGTYTLTNAEPVMQKLRLHFAFPAKGGTYDAFAVYLNGEKLVSPVDTEDGVREIVELNPGGTTEFRVVYTTRGLGAWRYRMDPVIGRVQNFTLHVDTNFRDVDYPDGCLSPMTVDTTREGLALGWNATDLITGEDIGVVVPERLNPGPLTSRITYFAPVCLLFFFVLTAAIHVVYNINIHPMHYLFVAAGFFAFHLLLAYMAGLINIHLAFAIAALVSVTLVTSYLAAALRGRLPWKIAAAGQVFFLVLFSYSFFLEGVTGLTIAIGAVVTLAVLMRVTAHVNWEGVFTKPASVLMPPPVPAEK
jgi:hypothetical protein